MLVALSLSLSLFKATLSQMPLKLRWEKMMVRSEKGTDNRLCIPKAIEWGITEKDTSQS